MKKPSNKSLMTDFYELTMAQGYFNEGRIEETATFELFFRSNPFKGGYAIVAGIHDAMDYLTNFHFDKSDIEYLRGLNQFTDDFLDYLSNLEFEGEVEGLPEGSVAFPHEPLIQLTGPIGLLQLVESALLNIINFATLIATKASRIVYSTRSQDTVLEFGLRRAHGDGALAGSRAAMIGGCTGTSNTLAGKMYNLPVSGTQAHSWVQSFDTEIAAFRAYANTFPENTILLVDTYDTLNSGVPNAIKVAKEMEKKGYKLRGVRIDSGDLAWLAMETAKLLDNAGLEDVKIVLSSDLDEFVIESIVNQIALSTSSEMTREMRDNLIDRLLWGVGTHLITGSGNDKAALGGVYKLVEINNNPVIKISENRAKTTNPGRKSLWRVQDDNGTWIGDIIGLFDEEKPKAGDKVYHHSDPTKSMIIDDNFTIETIHQPLENIFHENDSEEAIWKRAKNLARQQLNQQLDESHRRFLNPHIYKVSLTEKLFNLKQDFLDSNV